MSATLAEERPAARLRAGPREIAPGVSYLSVMGSNVYFVRSGASWVLVDAAWAGCARRICQAAEALFGPSAPPAAILLTHAHPDHSGAAGDLARRWDCPVCVHPDEWPLAVPPDLATIERYGNPLDRRLILPLLRRMPPQQVTRMLAQGLKDCARTFDPGAALPGLPDWTYVRTPGHSPGHVAFFRTIDGVLLTGDALLTVDVNSPRGWASWALGLNRPHLCEPPWYTNTDQRRARLSIVALAGLQPRVLATGHGPPMTGDDVAGQLHAFDRRVVATQGRGVGRAGPRGFRAPSAFTRGLPSATGAATSEP